MSDQDTIRRADAIDRITKLSCDDDAHWGSIVDALRALPAVQVSVKPLEWVELEKYRRGGKYSADGYTIRYVEGFFILDFAGEGKWKWRWTDIEAAKAAAQADYEARIRSALTVQPSPDVAALAEARAQALRDAARKDVLSRGLRPGAHDAVLDAVSNNILAMIEGGK